MKSDAFAAALKKLSRAFPLFHPPVDRLAQISVSFLPTQTSPTIPWTCAIAYNADGALTSAPKGNIEKDPKCQLVNRDGRPSQSVERTSKSTTALIEVEPNKTDGIMAAALRTGGPVEKKKTTGSCPHCGKSTHPESKCFDKYPHLPKWFRDRIAFSAIVNDISSTATVNAGNAENEAIDGTD